MIATPGLLFINVVVCINRTGVYHSLFYTANYSGFFYVSISGWNWVIYFL